MASPTATQAPQTPISRKPIATASQDPIPAVFQEPQTDKMAAEQQAKQIALLNYKDYAHGDPVEVIYNSVSRTFDFKARSQLVHDENEICMSFISSPPSSASLILNLQSQEYEMSVDVK
jgi:hypothetical protein